MEMERKSMDPPPYSGPSDQQNSSQPVIEGPRTVIVQNPVQQNVISAVAIQNVGPKPSAMTCRSCGAEIVTRVEYKPSTKTHLIALLLCCCLCWCCACVPYCVDSCQNADHYCPNCNSFIGVYQS